MTAARRTRARTGSIWTSRLVRALAGQFGTGDDPMVLRSLGQLVPLSPSARDDRSAPPEEGRTGRVHEWTRSGLTYDEAELLVTLDESTPWYRTS